MDQDDYLRRLNEALEGLPPEQKALLLEEITAHIEEAEDEPSSETRGEAEDDETAAMLKDRLSTEMGSPIDLGHRLKRVHGFDRFSQRLIDYLLVVLPTLAMAPLVSAIYTHLLRIDPERGGPLLWTMVHTFILYQMLFVLIARWRGSNALLVYWLASAITVTFSLFRPDMNSAILYGQAFSWGLSGILTSLFWLAVFMALLIWLGWTLWQRRDAELLVLALIPLLWSAVAAAQGLLIISGVMPEPFALLGLRLFGLNLLQLSTLIWPALFFLPHDRRLHWLGLLLHASVLFLVLGWPYRLYPLQLIGAMLPLAVVLFGAWVELRR